MKMTDDKEKMEKIARLSHEISCVFGKEDANLCICSLGVALSELIYLNVKDPLKRRKMLRGFYETALSTLRSMGE